MTQTMSRAKYLFAFVAAAVLALALAVPSAFAGTITVEGVQKGETYTYYKLLNYTSSDTDSTKEGNEAYSYFLTKAEYEGGLGAELTAAGFHFTASGDGSQYFVNNARDLDAASLTAYLSAHHPAHPLATATVEAQSDEQAVFSDLATGYYFITTTTGSLCTLASYNDQDLVVDKHEDTTVTKAVTETTANVGDTLHFTVTVNAKAGETVTLHDTLSNGLTLDESSKPTTDGWTVTTWSDNAIEIKFPAVTENTTFTVQYTAKVNAAALSLDEVTNAAYATWGTNPDTKSETANTTTKLFHFDIKKVDGNNTSKTLDGVEFTLTNLDGKYYNGTSVWTDSVTKLSTANGGMINVKGIAAGTYTLTETKTNDGYNLLADSITVAIAADGTITATGYDNGTGTLTVQNFSGVVLPSTGGMGTTILYIAGGIMVLLAGVFLVSRRRASKVNAEESDDLM